MIIGLGIDIIEIERIRRSLDRFGRRFLEKVMHESEIEELGPASFDSPAAVARVAARFAAKEAGAKALGTGFSAGIGPHDIRVRSLPSGKPVVCLHQKARDHADALGVTGAHLSLSHGKDNACAVVVLEGETRPYERKKNA